MSCLVRISNAVLLLLYLFAGIGPEFLHHHHGAALRGGSEAVATHECRDHEHHAQIGDGVLCPFCLRAIEPGSDLFFTSGQYRPAHGENLPVEQTGVSAHLDYTSASKRGPPSIS